MSDDVQRALEAARCAAILGVDLANDYGASVLWNNPRETIAAAIAAFLRALPERQCEGLYGSNGYGAIVRLAAAVERAAREAE